MSFDFNKGSFFIVGDDGQHIPLCNCFSSILEYEPDIDEYVEPILFDINKEFSFSCELNDYDLEMLCQTNELPLSQNFTIEYNMPIMIQARWHKKARVRKKWLRRYGMRPDTVRVKTDATSLDEHDGSIVFETDSLQYVWKPHQQRKNIEIQIV